MTSTKLAFLTEATEAYTPYQGSGSYDDMIKTKMEQLVHEAYPWLGDFTLSIVDSDKDKSYACAAGTMRGFSSGYAVEFPVFYLEGDILDIPAFVLPERKLMLPFDESFYKIITSTLNNSDDIGLIREREDLSDALVNALADSDYHNVSEVIKMGSFSRIASFIPRRLLKSYAKTACSRFPVLTRDIYAALKLSQARSAVKTAAAADTAKIMFKEEDNIPFTSIVSPVFESEAEALELGGEDITDTKTVKVFQDCYVLPQANNKLSLTNLPTADEIAKGFGQDFEYLAPGEWVACALSELKRKPFEPFVSICPSSVRDYWIAPILKTDSEGELTIACDDTWFDDEKFRKLYDLARNNLGGEYATYEKANRRPFNERDSEFMNRSMMFYFPKYSEKRNYLSDILSSPLSVDHGIESLITGEDAFIPVMTNDNRFALMSLASSRAYSLARNKTKTIRRDGKLIINFYDNDGYDNEVRVKVTADSRSGHIKSIVYQNRYAPETVAPDADSSMRNQFVTLEFDDTMKTFNPYKYTLSSSRRNGCMELKPDNKDERGIVIGVASSYGYRNPLERLRDFTHYMYDPRFLDKDFVLNGFSTKKSQIEVGMPVTEITVNRNGKTVINLPRPEKSTGPKVIRYTYLEPEKAIAAMAHLGIEPEDLSNAYEMIKSEADHLASIGSDGVTKLAFTMTPAVPAEAPQLSSEAILQQAAVLLQNIQETQAKMEQDNELRSRMLDTQLQLVNEKLDNIEQLQAVLEDAVAGGEEPVQEEVPAPEAAPVEEKGGETPPEVIETLVSAALDPSTAEANDLGPDEVATLQAAAQGDEEAAAAAGMTGKDYQLFLQLYHENIDQNNYAELSAEPSGETGGEAVWGAPDGKAPAEPESGSPSEEDLQQLAQILADPKAAKREVDPAMVDDLLRAVLGDEEAAARIGITVEVAKAADRMADQMAEEKAKAEEEAEKNQNIEILVQILADPEAAKKEMGNDMVDNLLKAVEGDEEAAKAIEISVADAQAAAFRAQSAAQSASTEPQTGDQEPAESGEAPRGADAPQGVTPEGSSDEDINTLAQILSNEEDARKQVGDDMVDNLLKAVDGDAEAAEAIGISVADAQAAAFRAQSAAQSASTEPQTGDQEPAESGEAQSNDETQEAQPQGGLTEEDAQVVSEILADPEAAKQNYDPQMVDLIVNAANGDEEAAQQLGVSVEELQQLMQQQGDGGEQPQEEEQQAPQTPEEAGDQLKQNFDHAAQLVEAYFDPSKIQEYGISTDDLGTVTLVLRSPDIAIQSGIPGEQVQAISDAYKMITGKSVYQSAELEFENGAGTIPVTSPNLNLTKTAIPQDKAFEEYAKPLAQTSALLDLLPKVKTAKLFFKNADAFRDMLKTLGEILINLQINAVHYKESLGSESYKKLLTRIRKMYEDFGATVMEMYSIDKE